MDGLSGRARFATVVTRAALLAALLSAPHATAAQDRGSGGAGSGHLLYAAANALLGGLTGGIGSSVRSRPFLGGVWRGALGGGVSYLGKRLTAAAFPGVGLAGRGRRIGRMSIR